MTISTTKEIIDRIFKEPGIKYERTEFEPLGKPIHEILGIHAKTRVEQLIKEGRRNEPKKTS
jgi:type I restriction enzyme M protein